MNRANSLRNRIFAGEWPQRTALYRMKSCSSYGPRVASVDCSISPASDAGSSSGEIVVSTIERSVRRTGPSGNWFIATYRTRNCTSVLGIEQFGLYMLMWSPL